jgi:hypothetical protein
MRKKIGLMALLAAAALSVSPALAHDRDDGNYNYNYNYGYTGSYTGYPNPYSGSYSQGYYNGYTDGSANGYYTYPGVVQSGHWQKGDHSRRNVRSGHDNGRRDGGDRR